MFTGLIEHQGTIERVTPGPMTDVWVGSEYDAFAQGESIACDGVCLTVVEWRGRAFRVQAAPETLRRTTLGTLHPGEKVNLERALPVNGRLGGHIVAGHVDGIGTLARIIMSSISVAGTIIAAQTGLSYAEALDPTSHGQQGAVIGNFMSLLAVVLIFSSNLHHLAIGAVAGSYHLVPPGTSLPTGDMAELAIRMVSGSFLLGFQLAAPFIVFGFAINAGFGLLARMMPQLQVFFVVTPLNVLVGFVVLTLLLGTMMTLFLNFYGAQMGALL